MPNCFFIILEKLTIRLTDMIGQCHQCQVALNCLYQNDEISNVTLKTLPLLDMHTILQHIKLYLIALLHSNAADRSNPLSTLLCRHHRTMLCHSEAEAVGEN